jgi:hypothetical protein
MREMKIFGWQFPLDGLYTTWELGIQEIPKTLNGKVKRGHLQDMVERHFQKKRPPPKRWPYTDDICHTLSIIWQDISGLCPREDDKLHYFADSIVLLRFCDAVYRRCGRRLYLQDLVDYDTLFKISRLLLGRDAIQSSEDSRLSIEPSLEDSTKALSLNPGASSATGVSGTLSNFHLTSPKQKVEEEKFSATLEKHTLVSEAFLPIRHSMMRMVDGFRPQSYHLRIVFSVKHNDTAEKLHSKTSAIYVQSRHHRCKEHGGALPVDDLQPLSRRCRHSDVLAPRPRSLHE